MLASVTGCRADTSRHVWAMQDGNTPLHCASANGHVAMVRALVAKDADVKAKDKVCI